MGERETIYYVRTVSKPYDFEHFDEERKIKIIVHM